ncbi:MAG: PHP domain-containing protein [Candidatus Hydrogenedentes bacterium]|nr:PHP domain-containing protein [Candidatus Hydrogenedentota bacterium]
MRLASADLHIHSALSPCADEEMAPESIVYAAVARELDIIAVCDHNCAGNTAAIQEAAHAIAGEYLCVIPGMEITTAEEAHILGLFPDAPCAMSVSDELAEHLPLTGPEGNPFGDQPLMNAQGLIVGRADRLLSFATNLSLNQVVDLIRQHQGLVVAAHIDRPSFSILSQLGMIPDDVRFDALEISAAGYAQGHHMQFKALGIPLITSSDAHYVQNIGDARTSFLLKDPSFDEICLAFQDKLGRTCYLA